LKNHVLRIIAVVFALIFSLGLAAPAQASTWNLNQTPSGNPGCTKNWLGWPNCDRANAWGITASIGLDAVRQNNDSKRATAMKNAITVVVVPIATKAQADEINRFVPSALTVNQALCMKEELQRTTNRITAKSKLVKDYYSYLSKTYPVLKKAPLGSIYSTALKNSKSVATGVMQDTERNQIRVGLTSCLLRR
jgi:hypothetical protein